MITVVKRDGSKEEFSIDKINRVVTWATEGLSGVNVSDIEVNAKLNIRDGITTKEIHKVLVESAANLISLENSNYQYVAGRLLNYQIRKEVWGNKNAPKLIDLIRKNIERGYYTPQLLEWYSEDEINKVDEFLNHDRDLQMTYASVKQFCDKYLIQNLFTGELYETPQFRYIIVALTTFHRYKGKKRLQAVKDLYNAVSRNKVNLPTPVLAKMGTKNNSFASCCLIEMEDTKESIDAANLAVAAATYNSYGIGVNFGRMRSIGAPVNNGTVIHPGVIPFLRIVESTVKAWLQNSVRGGSATVTDKIWSYEIQDFVQLKNSQSGTHENRIFNLDYSVAYSRIFFERFQKGESITLFSTHEVPDLYDAFGRPEFDELYKKYENDPSIQFKKKVDARELFLLIAKEQLETGRIYSIFVDNINAHGPWKDKVNMSNLCVAPETLILTKDGYRIISEIEGEEVEVWNGKQWSNTKVVKTGTHQKLLKVTLSDGKVLECTPYHKWYVNENGEEVEKRTSQLNEGDNLIDFILPGSDEIQSLYVSSVQDEGRYDDTYCVNEPIENKVVFNGILTGNCQEVLQAIEPIKYVGDPDGEIGVCTLSAINWLEITSDADFEKTCDIVVRMLDEILDIQDYFCPAARNFATKKRSLGIGITNLAAFLAKNNLKYSSKEAPALVDEWMEKQQYYLIKASINLAKEKGKCEKFHTVKYSDGLLPIDWYKKEVDELISRSPSMDWEGLRAELKEHGMRHTTLTCQMPCESSSVTQNTTNGIEPVRYLKGYKSSKKSSIPFIVPNGYNLRNRYELAFDMPNNLGYLSICATLQKWMDMGISTNVYYNPRNYENGKIPLGQLLKEKMFFYKYGGKTMYYTNTADGNNHNLNDNKQEEEVGMSCTIGGGCSL